MAAGQRSKQGSKRSTLQRNKKPSLGWVFCAHTMKIYLKIMVGVGVGVAGASLLLPPQATRLLSKAAATKDAKANFLLIRKFPGLNKRCTARTAASRILEENGDCAG